MSRRRQAAGIYRTEIDQSEITQPVGTSTGAVVIRSKMGPINRPTLVSSDKDFIDIFGAPIFVSGTAADKDIPEYGYGSYAALEFLKESNALYVVRDYDTGDKYSSVLYAVNGSTSATSAAGIGCMSDTIADTSKAIYTLDQAIPTGRSLLIGPLGPGTDGNNLAVNLETYHAGCDWENTYDTYTSATTTGSHPIAEQVFKIQVFTKKDNETWASIAYSSISASPVETFFGTRTSVQDSAKNQLFIEDIVNGISQYIYVAAGTADFTASGLQASIPTTCTALVGGDSVVGTNIGSTDGWSFFNNREDVTVNILICPDHTNSVKQYVANIAATRQDCIAVGQTGSRTTVTTTNIKAQENYGYTNPSFMTLYAGWPLMYDDYNDRTVYLPMAIVGASLMARTDAVANVWDAPAGINRGIVSSLGLYKRFTLAEVGQLYDYNINTTQFVAGIGDFMNGQKTAQMKASALDRINVRRFLTFIQNSIEKSLLTFLFEPNNASTRLRVWSTCDSFLGSVAQGFDNDNGQGWQVVCDLSNNTPQVVNANQLYVDLYVRPVKVAEFIELRTIITKTGISFSSISI